MHRLAPWAVIALLLCGCSGAPTDGEIKAALQDEHRRVKAGAVPFEVVSVRRRSCRADGEHAYRCDVEMEIRKDNQTFQGTVVLLRLVKGNDGWSAQR